MKSLLIILVVSISGCVVFPTTRTYFEPDSKKGMVGPSRSCGYHWAAKDTYVVTESNSTTSIYPYSAENKHLSLSIFTTHDSDKLDLNPNDVVVTVLNKSIKPSSFKNSYRKKDATHKNTTIYYLHYPIDYSTLESFTVRFRSKDYKFSKVKKFDIYYASINC